MTFYLKSYTFLIIYLYLFLIQELNCIIPYHNIFIPFKTKELRIDYENDIYEYKDHGDDNIPLNPTSFLNKWFYNDIHFNIKIGSPSQELKTFINFDNSKFSISNCKHSTSIESLSKDKFISSKTFTFNNDIGNDFAIFYDNPNYFSTIYVNEQYNGIDFNFNEVRDENLELCGNLGLKMNNHEKTNFIEQLKHKGVIDKYIWTIDYQTLSQGVVIFGSEPHFYDSSKYFYSQYKTIYANLNNNNKKNWSFNFDKITINITDTNIIQLKDTNCELFIDHGLIIGTEEYKKFIEENYFNELIKEEVCYKEVTKLDESSDEYIIFYCDKLKFKGDFNSFSSIKNKPYFKFNDIFLFQKGFEYIFKLRKENLFEEIDDKVYFLIIFDKKDNNVWKLGEPFISEHKFIFNQEQKTIGFYNTLLEKIPNSQYDFDSIEQKIKEKNNFINNKSNIIKYIFKNMANIILIITSIFIILYITKKLLAKRKLRANELLDNYDYLPNKNNKIIDNSFGTQ